MTNLSNKEKAFMSILNNNKIIYSFDLIPLESMNGNVRYYKAYNIAVDLIAKDAIVEGNTPQCWVNK